MQIICQKQISASVQLLREWKKLVMQIEIHAVRLVMKLTRNIKKRILLTSEISFNLKFELMLFTPGFTVLKYFK